MKSEKMETPEQMRNERSILSFAKRSLRYMIKILYFPYCLFRVKRFRSPDLIGLIDFVFSGCGGLIKPGQVQSEILNFLKVLNKIKPKSVLEIGTANGGTLFLFSRIASKDALIISIDLPKGRFGGGYPKWKIPLYKSFALPKQQIHLIREDSHNKVTLEKVDAILNGDKIDFLFIDGDHTYEGVKKDFRMYSSLVNKNGIIAFHDIVVHPPETGCDVSKFWNKIKSRYENVEIVEDWNQGFGGIGFIKKR
jgi:predicted O-methyltransferase YrrM